MLLNTHILHYSARPISSSACGHVEVTYQMANAWNPLPMHLRSMGRISELKVALKQHLLSAMWDRHCLCLLAADWVRASISYVTTHLDPQNLIILFISSFVPKLMNLKHNTIQM